MSMSPDTPRENLTLSEADLAACGPMVGEGGHVLRALCPFHGSDHQRSLRVTVATGHFVCFACGAWGYLAEAREHWQEERRRQVIDRRPPTHQRRSPRPQLVPQPPSALRRVPCLPVPRDPAPARSDLARQLAAFQAALPGSRGAAYLAQTQHSCHQPQTHQE